MKRQDIHILSRHSNLSEERIEKLLKDRVYHDKSAWFKFLRIFIMSLGVGLTVSGIVFFFAYNWTDLHKFTKIGLSQSILLALTMLAIYPKWNEKIRNVILLGAAVLVGVLFAVFGQIYQTGANAYDFFLAWTVFISLWAWVGNFAPLWLLYLLLINTTVILYAEQIAQDWKEVFICGLLFVVNAMVVIFIEKFGRTRFPGWFVYTVALGAIGFATIGIVIGIFDEPSDSFGILLLLTLMAYILGIWHGLRTKSGFYLAALPFSIIIMITAWLINSTEGEAMLLLVSLFIIGSVTLIIKILLNLQKKWKHEA